MITNLYIDGFNLYYRALRDTPFKWLDLRKLAEALFPEDTINSICYFTALIEARPHDPSQPQRQQAYLRALRTLKGLEDYYGIFRPRKKRRPLVQPVPGLPTYVWIRDSEEKGSDVNLATRLLVDGFVGKYEQASCPMTPTSPVRCSTCVMSSICASPSSIPTPGIPVLRFCPTLQPV